MTKQDFMKWTESFISRHDYDTISLLPESAKGERISIGNAFRNLATDKYSSQWSDISQDIEVIAAVGNDPLDYVAYLQPDPPDTTVQEDRNESVSTVML